MIVGYILPRYILYSSSINNLYAQKADPVRGICGAHQGHKIRDVWRTGGGRGLRGGAGKRVDGVFSGRPQIFRYQHLPVDEREWRKTAKQEAERFIAKRIAAEKVRAGRRHAVTGRTKEGIAQ